MMSPHIPSGSLKEVSLLKLFLKRTERGCISYILTESEQLGEAFS